MSRPLAQGNLQELDVWDKFQNTNDSFVSHCQLPRNLPFVRLLRLSFPSLDLYFFFVNNPSIHQELSVSNKFSAGKNFGTICVDQVEPRLRIHAECWNKLYSTALAALLGPEQICQSKLWNVDSKSTTGHRSTLFSSAWNTFYCFWSIPHQMNKKLLQ